METYMYLIHSRWILFAGGNARQVAIVVKYFFPKPQLLVFRQVEKNNT